MPFFKYILYKNIIMSKYSRVIVTLFISIRNHDFHLIQFFFIEFSLSSDQFSLSLCYEIIYTIQARLFFYFLRALFLKYIYCHSKPRIRILLFFIVLGTFLAKSKHIQILFLISLNKPQVLLHYVLSMKPSFETILLYIMIIHKGRIDRRQSQFISLRFVDRTLLIKHNNFLLVLFTKIHLLNYINNFFLRFKGKIPRQMRIRKMLQVYERRHIISLCNKNNSKMQFNKVAREAKTIEFNIDTFVFNP